MTFFAQLGSIGSLIGILLIGALSGCTTNPVTGESQFSLISPQQEVAIGAKQYSPSQQSQGGVYTVDPDVTAYVNQVGQKLAAQSDRPGLPYEFVVLNNDVPNAWALPGGKIAINRGLLVHLDDEAQLAAVLGHEVVHAAARHSAQQMTQSVLLGVGTTLAAAAGSQSEYGQLAGIGAQVGAALYQARYGRSQELESDYYGMNYMAKAGYDPQAAVELQQTFVKFSEGRQSSWVEGLFASHPPSQQRVERNRDHAKELTGSLRNRQVYQREIAQILKDQPAYDKHAEAQKTASEGNYDKALALTNEAMKMQPKEPSFPTTRGQILLQKKDYRGAVEAFNRANRLYPEYFMPLLGRGLAEKQMKNFAAAEQDLEASNALLPTQAAVFHLGEIKLQQGDKQKAIAYFQQSAQGTGELAEKSQAYLQELQPATNSSSVNSN